MNCSAKPIIQLISGNLAEIVENSGKHLIQSENEIYDRAEMLIQLLKREDGSVTTIPLDHLSLELLLNKTIHYTKYDKRTESLRSVDCPPNISKLFLAKKCAWGAPKLKSISFSALINTKGEIINKNGYDAASEIYFSIDENWPSIDGDPTFDDACKAYSVLMEPFEEFCFVHAMDKSIIGSKILSSFIKPFLGSCPIYAASSPTPGSGKTKLFDIISIISIGKPPQTMNWGANEDEAAKRFIAAIMNPEPELLIDNIEIPFCGDIVNTHATQSEISVRPLGQSLLRKIPTTTAVSLNGNNLILKGDVNRRVLLSLLDPKVERPEQRVFKKDPVAYAKKHRIKLANAALTILKAHANAGYPQMDLIPLGSFESWSKYVRAPLVWIGVDDPCKAMERTREKDPELERLVELLSFWWKKYEKKEIGVRQVISDSKIDIKLYDIVESIRGYGDPARTLGNYLSKNEGRFINNLCFKRTGVKDGSTLWTIREGVK